MSYDKDENAANTKDFRREGWKESRSLTAHRAVELTNPGALLTLVETFSDAR